MKIDRSEAGMGLGLAAARPTDLTGAVTDTYETDAWGAAVATGGTSAQPFSFMGEEPDPESRRVVPGGAEPDPPRG